MAAIPAGKTLDGSRTQVPSSADQEQPPDDVTLPSQSFAVVNDSHSTALVNGKLTRRERRTEHNSTLRAMFCFVDRQPSDDDRLPLSQRLYSYADLRFGLPNS